MLLTVLLLCLLQAVSALHPVYIRFPTILYVTPGEGFELKCKASPAGSTKVCRKYSRTPQYYTAALTTAC